MSIDAVVESVRHNEDGSGELVLAPRLTSLGIRTRPGQRSLFYDKAPCEVTSLNGVEIWGGSESLMVGDVEIAKRVGYTRIVFADDDTFKRAMVAYRRHVIPAHDWN